MAVKSQAGALDWFTIIVERSGFITVAKNYDLCLQSRWGGSSETSSWTTKMHFPFMRVIFFDVIPKAPILRGASQRASGALRLGTTVGMSPR